MKKETIKEIKEYAQAIIVAIIVGFLVKTFVFVISSVPTGSMIPTVQINDKVFVSKIFSEENLEYGDIIVFHPPITGEDKLYLKRVIGTEGDKIEVKDGYLWINDKKIEETFISNKMNYTYGPVTVPKNKLFVLGDNRNYSADSHFWTETPFVDVDKVIGKGKFIVYPFKHIGKLE